MPQVHHQTIIEYLVVKAVYPASAFLRWQWLWLAYFGQDEVALTNVSIGRALLLSEAPVTVQMIATANGDRFDFEIVAAPMKTKEMNGFNTQLVYLNAGFVQQLLS